MGKISDTTQRRTLSSKAGVRLSVVKGAVECQEQNYPFVLEAAGTWRKHRMSRRGYAERERRSTLRYMEGAMQAFSDRRE